MGVYYYRRMLELRDSDFARIDLELTVSDLTALSDVVICRSRQTTTGPDHARATNVRAID